MEKYEKSWSSKTESRRLSCLGYLFSLPSETSARRAFNEFERNVKRSCGRLKEIWKSMKRAGVAKQNQED